ncbi:DUF1236 domain-containing protein [Streptomyces sp. NPDC055722]
MTGANTIRDGRASGSKRLHYSPYGALGTNYHTGGFRGAETNITETIMKPLLLLTAAVALASASNGLAQDTVIIEVPQPTRDYVIAHPSDPIVIEGDVTVGTTIEEGIRLVPIPDNPEYSYVYVEKRPVIVSTKNRKVVYLSQ